MSGCGGGKLRMWGEEETADEAARFWAGYIIAKKLYTKLKVLKPSAYADFQ
jgi:hypothetical protein